MLRLQGQSDQFFKMENFEKFKVTACSLVCVEVTNIICNSLTIIVAKLWEN